MGQEPVRICSEAIARDSDKLASSRTTLGPPNNRLSEPPSRRHPRVTTIHSGHPSGAPRTTGAMGSETTLVFSGTMMKQPESDPPLDIVAASLCLVPLFMLPSHAQIGALARTSLGPTLLSQVLPKRAAHAHDAALARRTVPLPPEACSGSVV